MDVVFTGGMSPRRTSTEAPVASDELFAPVGNEVELCYQTFGDPEGEPLMLVMGLAPFRPAPAAQPT